MRRKREPTPKTRFSLAPALWMVWAGACCIGLWSAGLFLAGTITVPETKTFLGTITPNQQPTELLLPAGVPLKSVLVQRGDMVRTGQTLAVFDQVAMQARLDDIERRIKVSGILRSCLLAHLERQDGIAKQDVDDASAENDPELSLLVRAAFADCAADKKADRTQKIRLERGLEILQEQLDLMNQKLAMLLAGGERNSKSGGNEVLRAHASLSVAIERNEVSAKTQALTDQLDQLLLLQDKARLARIAALSKEVAGLLSEKAILNTYLASPRLYAPENGRINRVRPLQAGTSFATDETLIEVQNMTDSRFVASLKVPISQMSQLPIGTEVELSLSGFTTSGPALRGRIDRWLEGDSETGRKFAKASILLNDESQEYLGDPRNGIALRGSSTASTIEAKMNDASFKDHLIKEVKGTRTWAVQWFAQVLERAGGRA